MKLEGANLNVDIRLASAAGVGLLAGGALSGWLLCRRYMSRSFYTELNAQIDELKLYYKGQRAKDRRLILDEVLRADADHAGHASASLRGLPYDGPILVPEPREPHNDERIEDQHILRLASDLAEEGSGTGDSDEDENDLDRASDEANPSGVGDSEYEKPAELMPERDTSRPYVISVEEYSNTEPEWQQEELIYYAVDKIVTDNQDEVVPGYEKLIGELNPLLFGGVSGDPHIRYVRNEQRTTDFEILLKSGSYTEEVLNYGKPK